MSAYTHHGDCSTSDPCKRCFEFGQTTEQQRIIKMLEDDKWHNIWWPDRHVMCIGCSQIALIKGEN